MDKPKDTPTLVTMHIEVPESLRTFVMDWSDRTGEPMYEIVQSLFSHGLASVCAANDWQDALVHRVAPILEDLVACSGEDTEILHVDLITDAVLTRRYSKR